VTCWWLIWIVPDVNQVIATVGQSSWSVEAGVRDYPLPAFHLCGAITDYSWSTPVHLLRHIRSDNIIRTSNEEIAEMMNALGFQRRGPRITARLTAVQQFEDTARS
jgi:hypothetical protein